MIAMIVNRPLGEDDVGLLGFDQAVELVVMVPVNDGLAVNLAGKSRARLEDLARF